MVWCSPEADNVRWIASLPLAQDACGWQGGCKGSGTGRSPARVARRFLEQQTGQGPVRQPQQEPPGQPQRQHRFSSLQAARAAGLAPVGPEPSRSRTRREWHAGVHDPASSASQGRERRIGSRWSTAPGAGSRQANAPGAPRDPGSAGVALPLPWGGALQANAGSGTDPDSGWFPAWWEV